MGERGEARPALGEVIDDLDNKNDEDDLDDTSLVIIEEKPGPATRRRGPVLDARNFKKPSFPEDHAEERPETRRAFKNSFNNLVIQQPPKTVF